MLIDKEKVRKILCIKPRGIGDVVLSTVVFKNLKYDFPASKIDYLTEKPSKSILETSPYINEVLLFESGSKLAELKTILKVRKRKYDLILDFYSNPRTAIITFLSGAKYKAGFPYRGRKYAYNLFGPEERDKYHAAQLHLEFLKNLGLTARFSELNLTLTDKDKSFADNFFSENFNPDDFVVGISPSGGWQSKKCDPVKFAEIADAVIQKYNAKVIVVWGPGDKAEADKIVELMKEKALLAPPSQIREMAALMFKCKIVIANDSGPMHIAVAIGTPVLSLHGPTDPKLQGPFGEKHEWVRLDELECICCNLLDCPKKHECFLDLPVERVLGKIDLLIKKNNLQFK